MKSSTLLIAIIFISAALGIGWFFDNRLPKITTNTLEVPDNIDYYLSNLKYRSMNQQGTLHYLLETPYLEHFILQDTSHLQQPNMQFYGDNSTWYIQAETGKLQHKEEQFTLLNQVQLTRNSPQQPMQLTTQLMILQAHNNLIEIPRSMLVTADKLNLQAASAVLDLNQNRYQFKHVKATYQPGNSRRVSNEQS